MNNEMKPVGLLTGRRVRSVLVAATAAPSLHNTQPWRFECTDDQLRCKLIPVARYRRPTQTTGS